jgi:site-specific recombinase XerD
MNEVLQKRSGHRSMPDNDEPAQAMDSDPETIRVTRTTRKTRTAERGMGQITLQMLIDFYAGDMQRRGCSPDSVNSNQRSLGRFHRFLAAEDESVRLAQITPELIGRYVSSLQSREEKWSDHPHHPAERAKLSPFTILKEVKVLRGFGTWLTRQGYPNRSRAWKSPRCRNTCWTC